MEVAWEGSVPKAQISLEFLLILGLSLSLILVYASLFLKLKGDIDKFVSESYIKNLLITLERNIYEICLLGDGNKRNVKVNLLQEIEVSSSNNILRVGNYSISSSCNFEANSEKIKRGIIKIENSNGKILWDYSD